jgi:hypothetical protein
MILKSAREYESKVVICNSLGSSNIFGASKRVLSKQLQREIESVIVVRFALHPHKINDLKVLWDEQDTNECPIQ